MNRARWNPQYYQHILATDPIGYWMQDEKQGAVSYEMVTARSNAARNGAYTGVTLAQPGIGDGRTAPFFDGVNDFNNVFSASLQGAFNGSEGTVMAWARVFDAGVWTDVTDRMVFEFHVNVNNRISIWKDSANNRLNLFYRAGGVSEHRIVNGLSMVDWFHLAITWSAAADEVRAYIDGVQQGATMTILGVWAGVLAQAYMGSYIGPPTFPWHGYIAHAAVWDRPLTPAQIAVLYEEAFT